MSVEENLAESIRKDEQGPRMKAYIAGMPARDEKVVPWMVDIIKCLYSLDAVPFTMPSPGYDRYTYVAAEDILFRKCEGQGIVLLEMQDRQGNWHVLCEAYRNPMSKKRVLEILCSEMPRTHIGYVSGPVHTGEGDIYL